MNQPFGNCSVSSFLFCAVSLQFLRTGGLVSTHWKLSPDEGKVIQASAEDVAGPSHASAKDVTSDKEDDDEDLFFEIVTTTQFKAGGWRRTANGDEEEDIVKHDGACKDRRVHVEEQLSPPQIGKAASGAVSAEPIKQQQHQRNELDCGKPANFTYYDHLPGVSRRHSHPEMIEPHLALVFHEGSSGGSGNFKIKRNVLEADLEAMEKALKRAKKEKPRTEQLYNQLGNYWRIRGDSVKTIECFRKALTIAPNSAEVLINLARVLLNLQYKEDALFLAKRSLEVHPPHLNPWLIHFTLGEIFKEFGHYQEAALHLKHCVELKPSWTPAVEVLREMGDPYLPFGVVDPASKTSYIHVYTVLIIVFLVLGVLLGILSSIDGILVSGDGGSGSGSDAKDVSSFGSASNNNGKRHGHGHGHHGHLSNAKGKWRRS